MSNHYGFSSYASRLAAAADPYRYESPYATSSRYLTSPSATASLYRHRGEAVNPGVTDGFSGSSFIESIGATKRHLEALYHQSVLGTHDTGGQEALYSSNSLVKRLRYDTASSLPIYPQRPGEKDCAHYMLTRSCKFGETCKFDHPLWVPEGGIPDWKEAAPIVELPERPGEPDCPYYLKTKTCKFGIRCKFNHPRDKFDESNDASVLPERPSEPICSYYSKTGKCKFGANCKFHHPKDIQIPEVVQGSSEPIATDSSVAVNSDLKPTKTFVPPALFHNAKGLPVRPGGQDCPFYVKTGSCKFGAGCRFSHPDQTSPVASVLTNTILQNQAVLSAAASLLPNIDSRLAQTALSAVASSPLIYPQRPGELECDYYMKTGTCKFGSKCKFHHPVNRSTSSSVVKQPAVKLTLAGLPRREGAIMCPFYMKTGTCKYGAACKYDHPPPGEVMSSTKASGDTAEADADADEADLGNGVGDQTEDQIEEQIE